MTYIRKHWLGEHSLAWSFWVNLMMLRALILYGDQFTHPPFTESSNAALAATGAYFVVCHVMIFIWQAVGLIRACDRFHKQFGSYMTALATHGGLAVVLFFTVTYAFGAFQSLFITPLTAENDPALTVHNPPGTYTLELSPNGTRIHVDGDFEIGITAALSGLLAQHPGVEGVVLNSNGGRVAAGRGVAQLIKTKGLDTYVFETCKSACTTAFIGGRARTLGANGQLGFHQFSVNAANHVPYIDPKAQQNKELEFYTAQNIEPAFLDKIFRAAHSEIWFPSRDQLLAAGVAHKIIK